MPTPEPRCSTCEHCEWWIDLVPPFRVKGGFCNIKDKRPFLDPHADTAPAWCPLRKERGE